jgi:polysaccharide biosynthesis protein PelA
MALALCLLGLPHETPAAATKIEPEKEVARRVLVLHGWHPQEAEKPQTWPVDSLAGELFQTPLEWLGYEVEYHDVAKGLPESPLPARFAGVLLDGKLEIPHALEFPMAEWLIASSQRGVPLLFTGGLPFTQDEVIEKLRGALGFRGSNRALPQTQEVKIEIIDSAIMQGETPVTARKSSFHDLQAPEKARVFLSLSAQNAAGGKATYEPAYLTTWGGMWLEPYVVLRASSDSQLFYGDPYKFLAAWLAPRGVFPAPDTSTRDGRRLVYSHIDGDGFSSAAQFKGHPICAEIIRDRILKAYPFPITVSVVESDIRALSEGLAEADAGKFLRVAREIFALPNVQAASHTFSHPYMWEPRDDNPGTYDEPNLKLKAAANYPVIDIAREIRGSVNYINTQLLPPGKRCELLLWSGNCRPGPAAIRLVRELGLDNLNGGNTIISRLYPGLAGVAPRTMWWEDQLQVHASNQNEFMYANGFNGPFYGGFADVIDTFERTESPRRLKPVNIYYHFYSATYLSSQRALEKIHQWALGQKLHSITAKEFVALTKDSLQTRISELGPRHWRLTNAGLQRTFRLPSYLGKPDFSRSNGVTGYTEHEGQLYLHTQGNAETELVMMDREASSPPHVYLVESSGTMHWHEFAPAKLDFSAQDYREIEVVLAGLPAGASCDLTINGAVSRPKADAAGRLLLHLPPQARVTLDAASPSHVSTR